MADFAVPPHTGPFSLEVSSIPMTIQINDRHSLLQRRRRLKRHISHVNEPAAKGSQRESVSDRQWHDSGRIYILLRNSQFGPVLVPYGIERAWCSYCRLAGGIIGLTGVVYILGCECFDAAGMSVGKISSRWCALAGRQRRRGN